MMNGDVLLFFLFLLLTCIFILPFLHYLFYFALIESETLSISLILIQDNHIIFACQLFLQ